MTPKCPYCSGEMRPGLSDTVDLAGPYIFRRDIQFQAFGCLKCRAIVLRYEENV